VKVSHNGLYESWQGARMRKPAFINVQKVNKPQDILGFGNETESLHKLVRFSYPKPYSDMALCLQILGTHDKIIVQCGDANALDLARRNRRQLASYLSEIVHRDTERCRHDRFPAPFNLDLCQNPSRWSKVGD